MYAVTKWEPSGTKVAVRGEEPLRVPSTYIWAPAGVVVTLMDPVVATATTIRLAVPLTAGLEPETVAVMVTGPPATTPDARPEVLMVAFEVLLLDQVKVTPVRILLAESRATAVNC